MRPPLPYSQDIMAPVIRRDDRARSMPALQFEFQIDLEKERILRHFRPGGKFMKSLPMDPAVSIGKLALHNIRARWMQWGIWDDDWEVTERFGHWMHEDLNEKGRPIHPECGEWQPPRGDTFDPRIRYTPKPVDEATLNKSRPINQFWSQVVHEREFLEETGLHDPAKNLDEQARENVRQRWVAQKMWSDKWQHVPGDKWDHELVNWGPHWNWFHKRNSLFCRSIPDYYMTLPAHEDMWFRQQPGGNDYECIRALPGAPTIVRCNCMPIDQRQLLIENPITSPSELEPPDEALLKVGLDPQEVQAAIQFATDNAVRKQVRKSRARPQKTSCAPRRSLRLQQKQERAAQELAASEPVTNKPVTKKQEKAKKTKPASSSTRRTPQKRKQKRH